MGDLPTNANDLNKEMINWRHEIHQYPKLGFEGHQTSSKISELLHSFGIDVYEGIDRRGIIGILKSGDSCKVIDLRADMDALSIQEKDTFPHKSENERQMHASGHDGHTAMLLGAAKQHAWEQNLDGTVIFIFQPTEEHGRGALARFQDGLFNRFRLDAIYVIHNMPSLATGHIALRTGPIMASEDNIEITIHGKCGHAALPHLTIDPIVTASEVVLALQTVISRTLNSVDNGVVFVTDFIFDATYNAIPEKVVLRGDTRSLSPEIQSQIEITVRRISSGICSAHVAKHSFNYSHEFAETINSANEAAIAAKVSCETIGDVRENSDCQPIMASEDFGFMLQHRPDCYFLLGNDGEGLGGCGLHSPN